MQHSRQPVHADYEYLSNLIEELPVETVDLVGKTTLGELAEVLRGARIAITNDTSALHIGAAVNASTVCILGGEGIMSVLCLILKISQVLSLYPLFIRCLVLAVIGNVISRMICQDRFLVLS